MTTTPQASEYARHSEYLLAEISTLNKGVFLEPTPQTRQAEVNALRAIANMLAHHNDSLCHLAGRVCALEASRAPAERQPRLRYGIRHKATGTIVAAFEFGDIASTYQKRGHQVGGWREGDTEIVDMGTHPPADAVQRVVEAAKAVVDPRFNMGANVCTSVPTQALDELRAAVAALEER